VQHNPSTIDDLLCAVLRGTTPHWPWADAPSAIAKFQARARLHGVEALLHVAPLHAQWPQELRNAWREQAIQLAMWEMQHQQILARVMGGLAAIDVHPVLIKGTAMAYSLYPDPAMRARSDTDLIVPAHRRDAAFAALRAMGFERDFAVTGEFVSYQSNFSARASDGTLHTLDVHWKINNSQVLSRVLTYQEARAAALPLPALCRGALGPSHVHGLLIAAFHRATHIHNPYYVEGVAHYGGDRLIWLYDIDLLARSLTQTEWDAFCVLALDRGLDMVCMRALIEAQQRLGTPLPVEVQRRLAAGPGMTKAMRYLSSGKLQQQFLDLLAAGNWADRRRYLAELLFPSVDYMRAKYQSSPDAWLPWLYLRRALGGVRRTLGLGRGT
jgi:hypothetical protein